MSFLSFINKFKKPAQELPPIAPEINKTSVSSNNITNSNNTQSNIQSTNPQATNSVPSNNFSEFRPPPKLDSKTIPTPSPTSSKSPMEFTPPTMPNSQSIDNDGYAKTSELTPSLDIDKDLAPPPLVPTNKNSSIDNWTPPPIDEDLAPPPQAPDKKEHLVLSKREAPAVKVPEIINRHKVKGPLFVKIDDFRSIMANLDLTLNDLKESKNIVLRLNSIKNGLDGAFEKWHQEMEDIQRKLVFIDKTLFER